MSKRIVIIGGSAAGPKAASKARRLDQNAKITMIQKGSFLSMASCGFPYYVGGVFDKQSQMVREPASFENIKDISAIVNTEVTTIDRERKVVITKNLITEETVEFPYDKLVIATGSEPIVPPITGIDLEGVTTLQSVEDAKYLKAKVQSKEIQHAVVIGGGLIGIETTEALQLAGIKVTVVERLKQILSFMDWEMATLVENHIKDKGSSVLTDISAVEILGDQHGNVRGVKLSDGSEISCQLVVVSVGVRPNSKLAKESGLEVGRLGGVRVNKYLQTNDPDIYAAGDCIEPVNIINGEYTWLPMGDAANLQARVVGQNLVNDQQVEYKGVVMTAICQAFDYTVANTGLSEKYAKSKGFPDVISVIQAGNDKPGFMGAKQVIIKMVADRKTGKFLGMQAVGAGDVSKRIAIGAMALHAGFHIEDLVNLDLPYAPPYSPAIDNFITAAHVLENKFLGRMKGISAAEVLKRVSEGNHLYLLDVRNQDEYEDSRLGLGEVLIPLPVLRRSTGNLPKNKQMEIIVYCKVSLRGYEAATFLTSLGYENVKVMEGGMSVWPFAKEK